MITFDWGMCFWKKLLSHKDENRAANALILSLSGVLSSTSSDAYMLSSYYAIAAAISWSLFGLQPGGVCVVVIFFNFGLGGSKIE